MKTTSWKGPPGERIVVRPLKQQGDTGCHSPRIEDFGTRKRRLSLKRDPR